MISPQLQKRIRAALCFLIALIAVDRLWPLVDLKNANFSDAWVDMKLQDGIWGLERGYNSRTLHNGLFGFGWCSDFETFLSVTDQGDLKVTECGAGSETILKKASSSLGTRYVNEDFGAVEIREGHYVLSLLYQKPSGSCHCGTPSALEFDSEGRLVKSYYGTQFTTYVYEGRLLRYAIITDSLKVRFDYFSNGKISKAQASDGQFSEYWYSPAGDLVRVHSAAGNSFNYSYDTFHNLTRIDFPDHTFKRMIYNTNMDWIIGFKDIDESVETYRYEYAKWRPEPVKDHPTMTEEAGGDSEDHYWAVVEKRSGIKPLRISRYEFWYRATKDGRSKYLAESFTVDGPDTSLLTYDEGGHYQTWIDNGIEIKRENRDARAWDYDPVPSRVKSSIWVSFRNVTNSEVLRLALTPREKVILRLETYGSAALKDKVIADVDEAKALSESAEKQRNSIDIGANVLESMEEYEEAARRYREALALAADDMLALSGLSRCLMHMGADVQEVSVKLQEALESNPSHPLLLESKGLMLLQQNHEKEAEQYLRDASELLPRWARIHDNLASAYLREGKNDLAKEQWQKEIQLLENDVRCKEDADMLSKARANVRTVTH